jgi:hypothetical protein
VAPRIVETAFSRINRARMAHASSWLSAKIFTRSKKSASPGYVWIFDCAADPDSANAVSTTPGSS